MTRHLDVDRTLESWLAEGPSHLPDYVIDGIVRQLDEKNQRRWIWPPRREQMNRMILAIGGVAAAVALAFVAVGLYFNGPGVAAPPQPTEPPTATAQPTAAPTASPTPAASMLRSGPVEPGRYYADVHGYRYTFSVLTSDWEANAPADNDGWGLFEDEGMLLVWGAIPALHTDACQWTGTAVDPGPTAEDFAIALAAIEGFESTEPVDVIVDGYHGKRLQLTVPDDADFSDCDIGDGIGRVYRSFGTNGRYYDGPGQSDDIWILDLEDGRHLFHTSYNTAESAATRPQLEQLISSLEIEPLAP